VWTGQPKSTELGLPGPGKRAGGTGSLSPWQLWPL
jgi:hypothetical protein